MWHLASKSLATYKSTFKANKDSIYEEKKVDFVMNMKVKREDKNIQGKSEKKDGKKEPRKAHTCSYNRFLFPLGTVLYLLLLVLDQ